jgi:hypothetical protein
MKLQGIKLILWLAYGTTIVTWAWLLICLVRWLIG